MLQGNYESVSPEVKGLLLYDRVESGKIPEAVFAQHISQLDSNPKYLGLLQTLSKDAANAGMYSMMVALGPQQILALVAMMVDQGALDKSDVRAAAKIKSTTTKAITWQNQVRNELFPAIYEFTQTWWTENRESIQAKHPEVAGCDTLTDFLAATGKASLGTTVDKMTNSQSGQDCALAITFRIDHNCASRNGTQVKEDDSTAESNGI